MEQQADLFTQGIAYFNAGYYFEAHDAFEELWMDERGRARSFYQGLVQLATGFYHATMRNFRGARSQLAKGTAKLAPFQPAFMGVELNTLLRQVEECSRTLERTSPGQFSLLEFRKKIPKLIVLNN